MNSLEQAVHELVVLIMRTLFGSDDSELQSAVMGEGRSDSERGSAVTKLITGLSVKGYTPGLKVTKATLSPAFSQTVVGGLNLLPAVADAVKVAAKLAKTDPEILATAISRYRQTRPIVSNVVAAKAGPPGWLGKLLQWGHVYQSQYYKWLYEHNQLSADERYGRNQKMAGPNWHERQWTAMRGPMWAYEYAEPGARFERLAPFSQYLVWDSSDQASNWSQFKQNLRAPEEIVWDWIRWTTGRQSRLNFRYQAVGTLSGGRNKVGELNASLFDWSVVDEVFKQSKYLRGRDPRWASLLTVEEYHRFVNWFKVARWLVWVAETWRANDPRRHVVDDAVESRWIAHTHKWGVGFVFQNRLGQRELFGQNLEMTNGDKAAARMNAHATLEFNTQRLLELVMEQTPSLMDLDSFRDVLGSMCDWPESMTGSFAPIPRDPDEGGWYEALNRKVDIENAHSPAQKVLRNVARGIVSVISSQVMGTASIYFEQLMATAEGAMQEVISDVMESQLWALVSTPAGQVVQAWETAAQDAMGDIWGMYDSLRDKLNDSLFDEAKSFAQDIKTTLQNVESRFPWAADLYGEVVPLPNQSRDIKALL